MAAEFWKCSEKLKINCLLNKSHDKTVFHNLAPFGVFTELQVSDAYINLKYLEHFQHLHQTNYILYVLNIESNKGVNIY